MSAKRRVDEQIKRDLVANNYDRNSITEQVTKEILAVLAEACAAPASRKKEAYAQTQKKLLKILAELPKAAAA